MHLFLSDAIAPSSGQSGPADNCSEGNRPPGHRSNRWSDFRERYTGTRARLTKWPAKVAFYAGPVGLQTLKAHMRTLYRERKDGTGEGYGHEFFRGMLHGLALADAIDAEVSIGIQDFFRMHGWIAD